MAETPTNLSAGIPIFDFATQTSANAINAVDLSKEIEDGSLSVAQDIQRKNNPETVDLSKPLYGSKGSNTLWNTSTEKPSLFKWNTDVNQAYTQLNNGTYSTKFENYVSGVDNEDRLAQQQGFFEKSLNGLQKFGAKTAINVLDATIGSVNGLREGVRQGSFNAIYNNDFSKWIDDLNTKLDNNLPNYYSQQERDNNVLQNVATTNFWADKVLGGMSFVAGTIISEAIWATATGGSSLATIGARSTLAAGVKNQNKILHSITAISDAYQRTVPVSRALKAFNNARFLYTSAGYEAGVEARHYLKEAEGNYIQAYLNEKGERPSGEELAAFRENSLNSANGLFAANLALVGGSNIAQFGTMFGVGEFNLTKGLTRNLNRSLGIGVEKTLENGIDVYRGLNPSRAQRIIGNTINVLKSPIREGFIEEGGQSVLSNFGQRWLESKYNLDAVQDNFSTMDALGKSFAQTYGTKEGLEEVFIGSLIGGLSNVRNGFGLKDYGKSIQEQATFANYATVNSNYNLTKKFFETSAQKASKERAENSQGVVANQDLQLAMFSKLQTDDMMGLLDNSVQNFTQSFEETNIEELSQQLNISPEEAQQSKDSAILSYKEAVNNYKDAQRKAEALIPEGQNIRVDRQDAFIPNTDAQAMLALNIYMGKNSDSLAKKYAQTVADIVSDSGVYSALQIETELQDKSVDKSKQLRKLNKELKALDFALNSRNNELLRISSAPRTEQGDNRLVAFETRRQELLADEERDTARRAEIQTELETIASQVNDARKARAIANQDFEINPENVTAEKLLNISDNLSQLGDTLNVWRNNGQTKAAEEIEYLINEYDKAQKSFRYANEVFEKLADPNLRTKELTNIFSPFLRKAKKAGADISSYDRAEQELFSLLASQYNELKSVNRNIFEGANEGTVEGATQTTSETGDNLPPLETIVESPDFEQRKQELLERQAKEIEAIQKPVINGEIVSIGDTTYSTRDIDGTPQYLKQVGDNPATLISKEEYDSQFALENSEEQQIIEKHRQELIELENDNLQTEIHTPDAELSLREKLNQTVQNIIQNRRDVQEISTPMVAPTQEEMDEYKKLYERNRRSTNGLRPQDRERFNELSNKFNTYGRAVGTVEGGIRLSDVLEQIATLEDLENNRVSANIVNNTNTEEIKAKLSQAGAGQDNSNKTQYWEKSEFRVLENGNYSITGINLKGLVDIINTSNNTTVLYDKKNGQRNNRKQVNTLLTGENYAVGDRFIIQFEQGVEIGVTIGASKNLEIHPSAIALLNERTRFKIIPSTTLGTNYQPLLQELNSNAEVTPLEIVNSNFELEPGLSFTDITSLPDDTELSLFVSTVNEFNKDLVQKYRNGSIKLQEVVNSMAIYVMTQNGEVGGVLKALNKNVFDNDGNYNELSQIRNIAVKRALESNLENEMIDAQITVPLDRNGSYFGKPNFNLIYNKSTSTLYAELLNISDKALEKITDVGYIQNGKMTLKDGKNTERINTAFAKKVSKGNRVPIIVFNYNNAKVAYPVSVNQIEVDKNAEFTSILNNELPLNEKVKSLNQFLSENNISPEFYFVGGETNLDDEILLNRINEQLSSQSYYNDFSEWMDAPNLEEAKRLVQQQAQINIDITDKPFHSPKLSVKLKEKTIIGAVENPVRQTIETTSINTSEIISENSCN